LLFEIVIEVTLHQNN